MSKSAIVPISSIGEFDVIRVKLKETQRIMTALVLKKMGIPDSPPQFLEVFQIKNIEFRSKAENEKFYHLTADSLKKEMGLGINSDYEITYSLVELRLHSVEMIKRLGVLKDSIADKRIKDNFYRISREAEFGSGTLDRGTRAKLQGNSNYTRTERYVIEPTEEELLFKKGTDVPASREAQLPVFTPPAKSEETRIAAENLFKPAATPPPPEAAEEAVVVAAVDGTPAPAQKGKPKISRRIKGFFSKNAPEATDIVEPVTEPENKISDTTAPVKKPSKPRTAPEGNTVLSLTELAAKGLSEYYRGIFSGGKKPDKASGPIRGKNGNKYFLIEGKPVTINTSSELQALINRPDWIQLASKGIDGLGAVMAKDAQEEVAKLLKTGSKPKENPSIGALAEKGQLSETTRWIFSGLREIGEESVPVRDKKGKPILDNDKRPVTIKSLTDIYRMIDIIGGVENLQSLNYMGPGFASDATKDIENLMKLYPQ